MSNTGIREKIIELLGAGVTPTQAAAACGVTDSYISQLLSDETVSERVKALRVEKAASYIEHDNCLDSDEEKARQLVRRNLDNGLLRPMEALKHFQVLNAARRQSQATGPVQAPTSTVVNLTLPAAAAVQFKMTVDKQVIEIDGRSMATMPAQVVSRLLREKKAAETLQHTLDMPKMRLETPSLLDSI